MSIIPDSNTPPRFQPEEEEVRRSVPASAASRRMMIIIIAVCAVLALVAGFFVFSSIRANKALEEAQAEKEQILLDAATRDLERESAELDAEFAQF